MPPLLGAVVLHTHGLFHREVLHRYCHTWTLSGAKMRFTIQFALPNYYHITNTTRERRFNVWFAATDCSCLALNSETPLITDTLCPIRRSKMILNIAPGCTRWADIYGYCTLFTSIMYQLLYYILHSPNYRNGGVSVSFLAIRDVLGSNNYLYLSPYRCPLFNIIV